jgi:hypothetical protein
MLVLLAQYCEAGHFSITGYEELDRPGEARLLLHSDIDPDWANQTLRVEISGAQVATLIYDTIEEQTDLGFFPLAAGNYTFDIYVLENLGATVEQSGSSAAHETIRFEIPRGPEPPPADEPLIDPVDLGFMIVALFLFGLVLAIWRTREARPGGVRQEPAKDEEGSGE